MGLERWSWVGLHRGSPCGEWKLLKIGLLSSGCASVESAGVSGMGGTLGRKVLAVSGITGKVDILVLGFFGRWGNG